ncbi:TPA: DUF3265 domain-containing protein [Vibrio parahaemolyticus]|nr:DUF3265 domain-containing protein [Vibrio parahaemolyticus]
MTKHLSAIHNAWHFWFASNFVFKAQCGSRCILRCSRLNAALVANEKIAAKTECLGLMFVCFARFCTSNFGFLVRGN